MAFQEFSVIPSKIPTDCTVNKPLKETESWESGQWTVKDHRILDLPNVIFTTLWIFFIKQSFLRRHWVLGGLGGLGSGNDCLWSEDTASKHLLPPIRHRPYFLFTFSSNCTTL